MKEEIAHSTLTILKADKQNAKEIVALLLTAWLHTYPNEQYQITEEVIRKKFGEADRKIKMIGDFLESIQGNSEVTYLVAEEDGGISGFLYSAKTNNDLYIHALYIHPERHRKGIGSSLLLEAIALNNGIDHVIVDVVSYNEQAIAFYRKHNFVIQGPSQTPFGQFPNGIIVPEVQMIKDCTDSGAFSTLSI